MKVLSVIMKIVETGIVCIWGVAVGIFFPVCIMAAERRSFLRISPRAPISWWFGW